MAELFSIGNKFAAFDGEATGSLSNLRLRITNAMAGTLTAELFNVLQSVIILGSGTGISYAAEAFVPFVFGQRDKATAANTVVFNEAGNLVYTNAALAACTITLTNDQNLSYRDMYNIFSAGDKFNVERLKVSTTTQAQINQGTLKIVRYTNLGLKTSDSYALSTDFSPNQQQSTLVDVFLKTELSKNQGLTLNVLAGETVDIQLFIRG
jgi:hypothetical protein